MSKHFHPFVKKVSGPCMIGFLTYSLSNGYCKDLKNDLRQLMLLSDIVFKDNDATHY